MNASTRISLSILFTLPIIGDATVFDVSWIGAVDDAWSTPGNWSGGVVPQNDATDQFNVTIDGDTGVGAFVTLSGDYVDVSSLIIDFGDTLSGYGSIGGSEGQALINDGLIDANVSSEGLYLSFQDGWVNSGTLQSSNGGIASLYGDGILDNTGGMLASSGGGSETIVEYGIVDGGSLSTSDSGRVVVTNGTLSNVTNDGETLLRIQGEDEYSVTTPKLSNTITNNAFIYVE
ncbi:hypothetical protein, partial [Cerasicoccus frondis]|uniref:hypothetical protein n=1 Tax=Cerasicoccus frondis TaxID=490090 RepID=UPI002852D01E